MPRENSVMPFRPRSPASASLHSHRAVFTAARIAKVIALLAVLAFPISAPLNAGQPAPTPSKSVSGIYPHLATFNNEGECGTGAVVPWADRLWVISYAPHMPKGSSDKLYEITSDLRQIVRPESIGGTPANRFIHRESSQLFIGPYAIDARGTVRTIPYSTMYGRPTGVARHLSDSANKVYYATMEEGIYEVDVHSLAVRTLWLDEQLKDGGRHADLPGYHGKGFYSGQGRVIYANNGEHGKKAQLDPTVPSGVLAEWDGRADRWTIVRRNQFTEVTGPGGIAGNDRPATDPVWSIGWDHRSLILQVLDRGRWHAFRLPKASHCYDGAHGWNTEWPRIREIGEGDALLMTMHGMFWKFPKDFSASRSAGIAPRSTYLKVVGDFCRWGDRIVLGCDDSAKSEFLNKRRTKGDIAGPGQSQSNLWFLSPDQLDGFGAPIGRGALWLDEPVEAGTVSDPFLFSGFAKKGLHLAHTAPHTVRFELEIDRQGDGAWTRLMEVELPPQGGRWVAFERSQSGAWVRLRATQRTTGVTAFFHYAAEDRRGETADPRFDGLTKVGQKRSVGGLIKALGSNKRTLGLSLQTDATTGASGYYELDGELQLVPCTRSEEERQLRKQVAIPRDVVATDAASVLVIDDSGKRWRLPKGHAAFDGNGPLGTERIDREVCTERDLLNLHGTFYELPAENAGGFSKMRPISSHELRIHDYCSYRGMLIMTGIDPKAENSSHIVRSKDGKAAVWVGAVDDLWTLGKPRGKGGPLLDTPVSTGAPSDPYLFSGYDRKEVTLWHDAASTVRFDIEVDVSGAGHWLPWRSIEVPTGSKSVQVFPDELQAYWVRVKVGTACRASAIFEYR